MQTDVELDTLPDVENPAPLLFKLIAGVLLKPRATFGQTFGEMVRPGKSWLIVALLALLTAALAAALNTGASMQLFAQNAAQINLPPGVEGPTPEALARQQRDTLPMMYASAFAFTVISGLLGWFVWAVCLSIGGTLLGGRSTFGNVFKMTVLSALPMILRSLIICGALLTGARPILNPGFSGFLAPEPGALNLILRAVLGSLDLFQMWNLVLLAIGLSVVTRMKTGKAAVLVIIIGILLVLVTALPGIVFGGFVGGPAGASN
jgi:hypothetical protein